MHMPSVGLREQGLSSDTPVLLYSYCKSLKVISGPSLIHTHLSHPVKFGRGKDSWYQQDTCWLLAVQISL